VPAFVQDAAVQPGLLRNPATGPLDGASCRAGHIPGLEVFNRDHAVPGAEPVRRPGHEVCAAVTLPALDLTHSRHSLLPVCRALPLPGKLLVQLPIPALLAGCAKRPVSHRAVRTGNRDRHTTVHADSGVTDMPFGRSLAVLNEERYEPVLAVTGHRRRAHHTTQSARPPEPHPSQLRQLAPTPTLPEPLHSDVVSGREPKRRPPAPHRPPPHLPRTVLATRPIEIHKGLLQHMRRSSPQPLVLSFSVRELTSLIRYRLRRTVVDPRTAPPILTTLLQRRVPHRPAHPADALSELSLLSRKRKPELPSGQHEHLTASSAARQSVR
jgi:hypothetical protein